MSKVTDESYIVIQGWMIKSLGLKGNELMIYAIIYGFSQDGESYFQGSRSYLADWTNSTKQGVDKCLKSLIEKGYIEKKEIFNNGVKFCNYRALKFTGGKQSCLGVVNKVDGGGKQSLHHNIDNITNIHNIDIEKEKRENIDYQQIADMYNDTCVSFPRLTKLSDTRKKAIKARLKTYSVDDLKKAFEMAESSSFLKGGNSRNWSANFDWIMKDGNLAKILDGNYINKTNSKIEIDQNFRDKFLKDNDPVDWGM